jgi:hypothetical protein
MNLTLDLRTKLFSFDRPARQSPLEYPPDLKDCGLFMPTATGKTQGWASY